MMEAALETEEPPFSGRRVFVLGDSRTGTTTIHKFLSLAGYDSIHYFFKESNVSQPAHVDRDSNWKNLREFIGTTHYNAFSDYPIRIFYKELFREYPTASFILTVRKDIETWQRSMLSFFPKFGIEVDIEKLTKSHMLINDEIRRLAAETGAAFCEICIDDDAAENGRALSDFLGLDESLPLGWENRAAAYDNAIWSSRVTFFNTSSPDFLDYVKRLTLPSKAMLSEHGWAFLINDSSDFFDYLYGKRGWSEHVVSRAAETLRARREELGAEGIGYLKFVIPEKAVVYPQYLPKVFHAHRLVHDRPAHQLEAVGLDFLSYPLRVLRDASSYGHLYFRGDSHANWLGAYFLYHHVADCVNAELRRKGLKTKPPIPMRELQASLAAYGGDLFLQTKEEQRAEFNGAWVALGLGDKIEHLVRYVLPEAKREAQRREVDHEYLSLLGERETFRFSHPNRQLPKAVIFRDSTADYLVDLLAEHFSESLFIWRHGHVFKDVVEREAPDLVLHIMAERFLIQYEHARPFQTLL